VRPLYNRSDLVNRTLHTVGKNLFEGALLVVVVLFALLGNLRAAFIVAFAIPLSMLFAVTGMVESRVSGNLMSLGAMTLALIIDGAVVMVENIIRHLAHKQKELAANSLPPNASRKCAIPRRKLPARCSSACSSSLSSMSRFSRSPASRGKCSARWR